MDTLENAYQCLKAPGDAALPQHTLRLLAERMLAVAQAGNKAVTQSWLKELKLAADRLGSPQVRAQARLECSRAALLAIDEDAAMHELDEAIRLVKKAPAGDLPSMHLRAQARWMLATLLVTPTGQPPAGGQPPTRGKPPPRGQPPIGDQLTAALVTMQGALDDFTRLVVYASPDGPNLDPIPATSDWYRDRCAEMRQGIERLVQTGSLGVPQARPTPSAGVATSPAAGAPKRPAFQWPISILYAGNLSSLPVVGRIPAGGFGPTGADAHANEKLPLQPSQDEFTISGVPHRLVNLRGSPGITQLVSSNTYFILQVTGDSMDADHIDKGDYVLLRQQPGADPMDIVAAEVVGIDPTATLKRFLRKGSEIVLEPRSTNPAHTPFTFKDGDRRFHIRGVVLGVFKPAP